GRPRSCRMKKHMGLVMLPGWIALSLLTFATRPAGTASAEERALAFSLKDVGGRDVALADFKDKKAVVVVFIGTECPVNNYYMPRLKGLHAEFAAQGVQLLAVNSNTQDAGDKIAGHARKHGLPFPVLTDADQKVADLFRAERTPEVFLLDPRGVVRYRGRIAD